MQGVQEEVKQPLQNKHRGVQTQGVLGRPGQDDEELLVQHQC